MEKIKLGDYNHLKVVKKVDFGNNSQVNIYYLKMAI